jgi:hypothetical protein
MYRDWKEIGLCWFGEYREWKEIKLCWFGDVQRVEGNIILLVWGFTVTGRTYNCVGF